LLFAPFFFSSKMPVHPASIDLSIAAIARASPQPASFLSCAAVVVGVSFFLISFRWAVHLPHASLKTSESNSFGIKTGAAQPRALVSFNGLLLGLLLWFPSGAMGCTTPPQPVALPGAIGCTGVMQSVALLVSGVVQLVALLSIGGSV